MRKPVTDRLTLFFLLLAVIGLSARFTDAQSPKKIARVGLLRVDSPPRKPVDEFRQTLRELGYIEGANLALELRWAQSNLEKLDELAKELVALNPDVLITHGPQGVRALGNVTSTIPIVIGRIDDIDMHGFVTDLARPTSNITGLSFQTGDLTGKCLELLKELFPRISNVAVLWDASGSRKQLDVVAASGRALGIKLQIVEVSGSGDFDRVFEAAAKAHARALMILGSPFLTFNVARLAKLSVKHRLAAVYTNTTFAQTGGLMAYGPSESDPAWGWKRVAVYVDKILKGTKPADLPVEQPTSFDLVVNLRTAKQMTIPPNMLARADKVIR
jgi:putative ABC transport system substrate-binding protein